MTLIKGRIFHPGVEEEIVLEQAKITISNVIDAIVELITNSDDSYLSIEHEGQDISGKIEISVKRSKKGMLEELIIEDEAKGMNSEKIEQVLRYGKKTSALYEGKSVRGIFGRGLKESILAMGRGEINSISCDKLQIVKCYWDYKTSKLTCEPVEVDKQTSKRSGTKINIFKITDVKCPPFNTLKKKISNHFALRDILSNTHRKVLLNVETSGYSNGRNKKEGPERLRYSPPEGQMIENKKIPLKGFRISNIKLYESYEPLDFSRNDPSSQAGILIKTTGAIIDNQLFGFDNDTIAHYFFGEVTCPGIAVQLKSGNKNIIKPDRSGINWKNEYCKELEKEMKAILSHHIERKRKKDESFAKKTTMPKDRAKKFDLLFKKLNMLEKQLIESDIGAGPGKHREVGSINSLKISPPEGKAPPNQKRRYTIYLPKNMFKKGENINIHLDNPSGKFILSKDKVKIKNHSKREDLMIGYFDIKGFRELDKTDIIAQYEEDADIAEFQVLERGSKEPGKNIHPKRRGGMIKDIYFNVSEKNPIQRTEFRRSAGKIIIYVSFPGISPFLGADGEGSETEQGSMLLTELIAETFCRETARRKLEQEALQEVDTYNKIYNEHLKKCVPIIHKIWLK